MKISKKLLALGLTLSIVISNVLGVNALSSIDKIQGEDRYETAAKIADKQNYTTAILVNSDKSLADGLSASGLAGAIDAPILLTKKDSIPIATIKKLEGVNKVYIIGLEKTIGKKVEDELRKKGIKVERLGGNGRIETSYTVAKEINEITKINKVILTNAYKGEADAMSVAPVAVRDDAPIILTNGQNIPFDAKNIESYVIGGKTSMSDKLVQDTNSERLGGVDRFDTNKKIINKFYSGSKEFYITKAYNLVDALTGSTIAKNTPIVLVHNSSDKSILKGAIKVTALGGIDKSIIQECMNAINGDNNQAAEKVVYVNGGSSSSNKYHKTAISHGMKEAIKMTESEAKKKGYVACNACF